MNRRLLCALFVAALSLPLGLTGPAYAAADLAKAESVVTALSDKGIHSVVTADVPPEERINRFRALFTSDFDVNGVAHFVLGRFWRGADPAVLTHFVEVFREVTIYTWAQRFKSYTGQTIKVVGSSPDGDAGAFVDTQVIDPNGGAPVTVRWRLRVRPEAELGWQVVDLTVEGVSLAMTQRSDYESFLSQNNGDIGKLIERLQTQLVDLKK